MVLLLFSAQEAAPARFAFAQPPMSEQDLTIYGEALLRINEMLNKPMIAVESSVYDALKKIIGDNVIDSAKPRIVYFSGEEIVEWYGGDEAVKSIVRNLGLYEKASDNDWLAEQVLSALKGATFRKYDAAIEKYYAGKVYQIFVEYKGYNDLAVDTDIVGTVKETLIDAYLAKTGNTEGVVYWHIASYFSGAPDTRAERIISQLLAPNGVAATRVTSGDRVAQALEPHFRRVYGVELIDKLIPAVEGKIKQTLADLLDWVKKHPIETALLVAVGTDMAITLLNQYSPPRSEEEANIRSAVQNAARYIAAGLSAGLQVRDMTLFFLALQTGTKTIALETGVGILIWAATNLLLLTLTGQWGKEFLIGKTCESVCGRGVCLAMYGVYAVPRQYYLAAIVDGETIAETRAENPNEASFWAVLEPFNVVKGDVAVKCAGAFCQVNVTSREVNETPTDNGCALVEEKLWMCSWKATVAGVVYSQKIFPVEKWLLGSPNYTEKCPWTPLEPGVNQQIDAAVRRVLALLDEEYSYVPVQLYATVKVEVASGCGGVAVLPSWRRRSSASVTVPVGSQVELHAQPCTACSLLRWEVSDGVDAWNATGYFLGLVVDRNLTVKAFFTDQPKVPKLILRAESLDRVPVYPNVSGWVFWVDLHGVPYNTSLSSALFRSLEFTLNRRQPMGFRLTANRTASWVGVRAVWYGSYDLALDSENEAGGCTYSTWDDSSYSTISGLHLLLVQAKGDRAYVYTKSGWLDVGSCSVMQGSGQTRRVSGWCVYTGTYNFNNAKPEVSESVCGWVSGTYSVAKKAQLKFLWWELRAPNGTLLLAWPGPEVYLPVWYDNKAYKWRGVMPPTTDDTYELVAIYGPPDASRLFTVKVYATLPDRSRVALPPLKINATTFGAAASTAINGSGVAQLTLPLGGSVRLSFPRVVEQPPFRLVVENATFNGKRFASMVFEGATASVTIPSFNESGTVEV